MKKALYPGKIGKTHHIKGGIQDHEKTTSPSWRDYTPISPGQ